MRKLMLVALSCIVTQLYAMNQNHSATTISNQINRFLDHLRVEINSPEAQAARAEKGFKILEELEQLPESKQSPFMQSLSLNEQWALNQALRTRIS